VLTGKTFINNHLIVVDECHHASSDSFMDVLNIIPGSYRFGMSGTPLKYDLLSDMKLMAATGDLMYDLGNKFLIDEEHSAKPIIHIATVDNTDERWYKADYQTAYDKLLVHNDLRNRKIVDFVKGQKGTVLILVDRIEHGKILQAMLPGCTYVTGSDTTERRQEVLQAMRRNMNRVFIASPIFDEGVDVPGVNAVVIAGGGASPVKILQRIGRGLRKKLGDVNELYVLDFIDDTNKHLLAHSNSRIDTYVQEGFYTKLDS
jgi:superfamily II DNA or RNA helicase